ncbi:MAG: hypothetical protein P0Y62_13760 [Candidatus Chryseobacterium colombiense]|nr:hypothetical protein [Chryseobacterium sp.]WEK68908.1 MAG: hypothetical protein P0Y62_13760 [Chryseobacterium sp.]
MQFIRIFLIGMFLSFSNALFSQKIKILSKKQILKVFKSTVVQNTKGNISTDSNPWFTDNSEDKYFKDKIIEFKNARSFQRDYCKIINWNFYKKDAFVIGDADYCNEPPMQKVTKPENFISLKLIQNNSGVVLLLFNEDKLIDQFLIISLEKIKSVYDENESDLIMKLKRLN